MAVNPGLCDLIGNSEDRFSHDAVISLFPCLKMFCFDAHEQNKTIIRKNKNGPSGPTKLGRGVPGFKNWPNRPSRGVPGRNGFKLVPCYHALAM